MKNQSGYEPSADEDYDYSETEISSRAESFRENKKRKRGMKKKLLKKDPLVVFGYDIMLMILTRLDAHSVATSLLVSRKWRQVGSSDVVWAKKVYTTYIFLFKYTLNNNISLFIIARSIMAFAYVEDLVSWYIIITYNGNELRV